MALSLATVEVIESYRDRGYSIRDAARISRLSRSQVAQIYSGEWREAHQARVERREERRRRQVETRELYLLTPGAEVLAGNFVRCSGCGGKVLMPCAVCRLRERRGW